MGVPTAGEQRGAEWRNKALVSPSFLLPLTPSGLNPPPILYVPFSHPSYCLVSLSCPLRSIERLLSQWRRKWIGGGGGPLVTLTQLVRLIKRVCGLWVRAQTHQETGRPWTPCCYRNIQSSNNLSKVMKYNMATFLSSSIEWDIFPKKIKI